MQAKCSSQLAYSEGGEFSYDFVLPKWWSENGNPGEGSR